MKTGIIHRLVPADELLSVVHLPGLAFEAPLHYHTEYELIHVVAGSGVEFVGGGTAVYTPGTLTLIGGGVPHLHLCAVDERGTALCEVLYFPQKLFPLQLSDLPELRWIDSLLERSRCGVRFHGSREVDAFVSAMNRLDEAEGIGRVCILMELLDLLGRSCDFCCIDVTSEGRSRGLCGAEEPLWRVHRFLLGNYGRKLSLAEIASRAGMSPAALCRYFRRRTGRTVFDYVNAFRMAKVCSGLIRTDSSVAALAAEAGFCNLSHFNRLFRAATGMTPTEYRRSLGLDPSLRPQATASR